MTAVSLHWNLTDFNTAIKAGEKTVSLEVMGRVRGLQLKLEELAKPIFYEVLLSQMKTDEEHGDRLDNIKQEFDIITTHGGNFFVFRITTHPISRNGRIDDVGMIWLYGAQGHGITPKDAMKLKFWWPEEGRWVYSHDVSHPAQEPRQKYAMIALETAVRGAVAILGG